MSSNENHTLTITGLTFQQAKEIAEHNGDLAWLNEGAGAVAYPTSEEFPVTITKGASTLSVEDVTTSYNAALVFIIEELQADDGRAFLSLWMEGHWQAIKDEFPEFDLSTTLQCDKDGVLLPV
jgi:hypothetical protein